MSSALSVSASFLAFTAYCYGSDDNVVGSATLFRPWWLFVALFLYVLCVFMSISWNVSCSLIGLFVCLFFCIIRT